MSEEMKKKIEEEALKLHPIVNDNNMPTFLQFDYNKSNRVLFIEGAEYGYNLANQYITINQETNEKSNYVTVEQLEAKYNIELRAYFKQSKEK